MEWLIAAAARPLGALVFFSAAAFLAYVVVAPLIPQGRLKGILFDKGIQQRHPWKFGLGACFAAYSVLGVLIYIYR